VTTLTIRGEWTTLEAVDPIVACGGGSVLNARDGGDGRGGVSRVGE
jgi:hypothetical protein